VELVFARFAENHGFSILNKIARIVVSAAPLKTFLRCARYGRHERAGATASPPEAASTAVSALHYRNTGRPTAIV